MAVLGSSVEVCGWRDSELLTWLVGVYVRG